jgi:predicted restriction endonuclease
MKQKPLVDLWSLFAPMVEKKHGHKPEAVLAGKQKWKMA